MDAGVVFAFVNISFASAGMLKYVFCSSSYITRQFICENQYIKSWSLWGKTESFKYSSDFSFKPICSWDKN